MDRKQLQHVILEIGERFADEFNLPHIYIIGSSAVFASVPDANDAVLTASRDVDVALPKGSKLKTDHIDFVIGEGTTFDDQNGYYAQGVELSTAAYAPSDWTTRTADLRIGKLTARCMELHDLALSKYGAGREKDLEFNAALVRMGALNRATLESRIATINATEEIRELIRKRIAAHFR